VRFCRRKRRQGINGVKDDGVKLSCVATDVMGVSGREMMRAVIDREADGDALAQLAKGKLRKKLPALRRRWTVAFARNTPSCRSPCSPPQHRRAASRTVGRLRARRRERPRRAIANSNVSASS
jgi:hypothetical protein